MRPDRFTAAHPVLPAEAGLHARVSHLLRHGRVRFFGANATAPSLRLLSALLALILAATVRPAHAVDLDTLIGFGQSTTSGAHYRPETWTPLTVYLTGQATRGVGQLQVSVRVGDHTSIYTRRIPLKDGSINDAVNFAVQLRSPDETNFYQGGTPTEIEVQLLMDGRSLAGPKKIALPIAVAPETYNVLGLTRDGSGLNLLNKKKLGLVHREVNPNTITAMGGMNQFNNQNEQFHNGINPNASLQVLYTDLRALPSQPQGYDMIDAIALGDQPLDNLTEDQVEALKGYVRQGGLLVISGGGDLARLKSQFYQELLPITPTGSTVVRDLSLLTGRYKTPLRLEGGAALTEGTLKPGARVLLGARPQETPLITSRPYGCGVVVFTAFDYLDPNIKSWQVVPALWRDLLRCGNRSVSARDVLAADTASTQNANLRLADALAGKRATTAPPLSVIGLFCAAYLVLLVPVNYFVLKRLDKRELTWLTAPVLIAGFTLASYLIARSIKGGDLTVNRAVVLETQANSDQVAGYGQMTVYSPRRAAYDISLGPPDDANNPYRGMVPSEIFSNAGQSLGQELTLDTDQTGTTLRGALIKLWDKRSFDTPVAATLGGSIDAVTIALPNLNTVQVTVTNHTHYTLTHCALIGDDQMPLDDLAPGESVTRNLKWNTRGGAYSLSVPVPEPTAETSIADKQTDAPEVTRARIANALLQSLANGTDQNQGYYNNEIVRGYGRGVNILVGRFNDTLLDVRINGQKPDGEEVNVLVAHLPAPANAPQIWRARFEPFAQKPALDLDDETPPGTRKLGVFK